MERSDKHKSSNNKNDNNNKSSVDQSYLSPMEKLKTHLQLVIDSSLNSMPDEDSTSSDSSRDLKTQLDAMSKVYSRFASDHHLPASTASSSKSYAEDDEHYKKAKHWMRSRSFDISSRNLLQKYQFVQPSETDVEESSQESSKLPSIKEDDSSNMDEDSLGLSDEMSWHEALAMDPKKIKFDKTTKTSPRSPRSVSVLIKPNTSSSSTTQKSPKSRPDSTDLASLRSRRSNEFHGFSRPRTSSSSDGGSSESISTGKDNYSRPRSKSIAVGTPTPNPRVALTQKKSEPNLIVKGPLVSVQEKERKLKRSDSEPYLYSWEYGNIEADLYLPKFGSINIYLAQLWKKKDNVLYQRVKQRKLRPSVSARFGMK